MATINYNGMKLKEITEPQVFIPPKKMYVIDELDDEPKEAYVVAIIENGSNYRVIVEREIGRFDGYQKCFEIPEEPKPRRSTNRELAKWLAQGNGEVMNINGSVDTAWEYPHHWSKESIRDGVKVRKWDDTRWHEPYVEYMGLEE